MNYLPFEKSVLVPTLFAPPAAFYARLLCSDELVTDVHETWPKQTLRNRYFVGGPNDIQVLTIPIKKPSGSHSRSSEIEMDYASGWTDYHRKALTTAYSKSPFFLYYCDYLFAEFERRHPKLVDLNAAIQKLIMKWLHMDVKISLANDFVRDFAGTDLRLSFKNNTGWALQKEYYQPFAEKFGFRNSLSILDILFNLGPEAIMYLKKENEYANLSSH